MTDLQRLRELDRTLPPAELLGRLDLSLEEMCGLKLIRAALPDIISALSGDLYRQGLEAAAKWHDEQARKYITHVADLKEDGLGEQVPPYWELASTHEKSAASVRSLASGQAKRDQSDELFPTEPHLATLDRDLMDQWVDETAAEMSRAFADSLGASGQAGERTTQSHANAGDEASGYGHIEPDVEPVSRLADGRTSAATCETMDATGGESAAPHPSPERIALAERLEKRAALATRASQYFGVEEAALMFEAAAALREGAQS